MDEISSKHFYVRAKIDELHNQSLRNESDRFHHDVVTLIDKVFVHLPAVFSQCEPDPFAGSVGENGSAIPTTEWIAWKFYHEHYCDVDIHADNKGNSVEKLELLRRLSSFTSSKERNELYFIQGDIGCGKTAFINHALTAEVPRHYENSKAWFLRVNIDVTQHLERKTLDSFFRFLCKKLYETVVKIHSHEVDSENNEAGQRIVADIRRSLRIVLADDSDVDPESEFVECVKKFSQLIDRRLVLILDNLDYYFHENDRYIFMSDVDTGEHPYINLLLSVVSMFYHGSSSAGSLGANVIFVLRPESYEILKESKTLYTGVEDCFRDNKNLYTLYAPNWDAVLLERGDLIKVVIETINKEGLKNSIRESFKDVLGALANPHHINELIHHLKEIVPFGLRSVMLFFKRYTWLNRTNSGEEVNPTARYIEQYPIGLICFMLDNQRCYSQKDSRFPNMYLANVEAEEEYEVNNNVASRTIQTHKLSHEHPPAFWLKRLLLEYIRAKNRTGEAINTVELVKVFSGSELGCYHESVVRLCLGSFAQTHASNLIKIKRQLSSDKKRLVVENIELTHRAVHCLDHIFDRFYYLQLVVDDYSLPLPRKCINVFKFDKARHYGYLVKLGPEYQSLSRTMVVKKAFQVTKFLAAMSVAMECERAKYRKVFERLENESVRIPNADETFEGVLSEIRSLKKISRSPASGVDVDRLKIDYSDRKQALVHEFRSAYEL